MLYKFPNPFTDRQIKFYRFFWFRKLRNVSVTELNSRNTNFLFISFLTITPRERRKKHEQTQKFLQVQAYQQE